MLLYFTPGQTLFFDFFKNIFYNKYIIKIYKLKRSKKKMNDFIKVCQNIKRDIEIAATMVIDYIKERSI